MHFKNASIIKAAQSAQLLFCWATLLPLVAFVVLHGKPALAWGERGHALVTQVAARLFVARGGMGEGAEPILKPFRDKELMLAHLSNVPDIVWRSLPREQTESLNPAHWINLEYLGIGDGRSVVSLSLPQALALALQNCKTSRLEALIPCDADPGAKPTAAKREKIFAEVGSAPWRVEQLSEQMETALRSVHDPATANKGKKPARRGKKERQGMGKAAEAQVNDALVAAGLLSHFVADLGQPFHATRNYDGFETGQGGIHSYYETQVVGELDLGLVGRVFETAKTLNIETLPDAARIAGRTPRDLAFLLAAHSLGQVQVLAALDKRHAVLEPSVFRAGLKIPAKRKPAQDVASEFNGVVTEQLAWSAVFLAEIYWRTWVAAGRPDLSQFSSYVYAITADPVSVSYLTQEN